MGETGGSKRGWRIFFAAVLFGVIVVSLVAAFRSSKSLEAASWVAAVVSVLPVLGALIAWARGAQPSQSNEAERGEQADSPSQGDRSSGDSVSLPALVTEPTKSFEESEIYSHYSAGMSRFSLPYYMMRVDIEFIPELSSSNIRNLSSGELLGSGSAAVDKLRMLMDRPDVTRIVLLGEEGGGKTTVARALANQIIDHSRIVACVPVIASLATWNPFDESFDEWLSRYIPDSLSQEVNRDHLLPVLDEFDMASEQIRHIILSIFNGDELKSRPMVLVSRSRTYKQHQYGLSNAAVVQTRPLDKEAILEFVIQENTSAIHDERWKKVIDRVTSEEDSGLYDALSRPLFLEILHTNFMAIPEMLPRTPDAIKRELGATLVRMKMRQTVYNLDDADRWLRTIAGQAGYSRYIAVDGLPRRWGHGVMALCALVLLTVPATAFIIPYRIFNWETFAESFSIHIVAGVALYFIVGLLGSDRNTDSVAVASFATGAILSFVWFLSLAALYGWQWPIALAVMAGGLVGGIGERSWFKRARTMLVGSTIGGLFGFLVSMSMVAKPSEMFAPMLIIGLFWTALISVYIIVVKMLEGQGPDQYLIGPMFGVPIGLAIGAYSGVILSITYTANQSNGIGGAVLHGFIYVATLSGVLLLIFRFAKSLSKFFYILELGLPLRLEDFLHAVESAGIIRKITGPENTYVFVHSFVFAYYNTSAFYE